MNMVRAIITIKGADGQEWLWPVEGIPYVVQPPEKRKALIELYSDGPCIATDIRVVEDDL